MRSRFRRASLDFSDPSVFGCCETTPFRKPSLGLSSLQTSSSENIILRITFADSVETSSMFLTKHLRCFFRNFAGKFADKFYQQSFSRNLLVNLLANFNSKFLCWAELSVHIMHAMHTFHVLCMHNTSFDVLCMLNTCFTCYTCINTSFDVLCAHNTHYACITRVSRVMHA